MRTRPYSAARRIERSFRRAGYVATSADGEGGAGDEEDGDQQQHVCYPLKDAIFLSIRLPMAIITRPAKTILWPAPVCQSGAM